MTSILGIVGSGRRWGNSELLVRQALRGAQREGASAQMLRLTRLHLESCNGCMRCVIGGKPCPLDDDMAWAGYLLEEAHVACVPGSPFGGKGYLRLSFATSLEIIEEGIRRMGRAIENTQ